MSSQNFTVGIPIGLFRGTTEQLAELEQLDLIHLIEDGDGIRIALTEKGDDVQLLLHQVVEGVWAPHRHSNPRRCRRLRQPGWMP
jgi:hypothetical protein